MIVRRLSDSIRRQNWFTVLVEIVIVVIGVFLGIQVSNWNEGRAHHRDYIKALGRLDTEITENLVSLDENNAEIEIITSK